MDRCESSGAKKKVGFILDHKLNEYRVGLFEGLSKYYDVTVIHRGPQLEGGHRFNQVICSYKNAFSFIYIKGLKLGCYDFLVCMQNIRIINLYPIVLIKGWSTPVIMWGIGMSSSKGLHRGGRVTQFVRNVLTKFSRGLALYSVAPLDLYWRCNRQKIFVVGNSLATPLSCDTSQAVKAHILFIGRLHSRKGVVNLVEAYKDLVIKKSALPSDVNLVIVGDGPEKNKIVEYVNKSGISDRVFLLGEIKDDQRKLDLFSSAYFVVSPLQAGLGVVESFSYGVPFVTSKKAITGGEALSIRHEYNGVLFDDVSCLNEVISSFFNGTRSYREMGSNAYSYFQENLTLDKYIQNFVEIIETRT